MPGRKKTPTNLSVLRGNPGKRALPKDEPQYKTVSKVPRAPTTLTYYGKKMWHRIWPLLIELRVGTDRDLEVVEAGCMAYQLLIQAVKMVNKEGPVISKYAYSKKLDDYLVVGKVKHPACTVRNEAHTQLLRCLAELGLTPAASTKVKVNANDDDDPLKQFLKNNGPQHAAG